MEKKWIVQTNQKCFTHFFILNQNIYKNKKHNINLLSKYMDNRKVALIKQKKILSFFTL